jgi:hypothetical protein
VKGERRAIDLHKLNENNLEDENIFDSKKKREA